MSLNWVMVPPNGTEDFVKLPHERILFKSQPRTSLSLTSAGAYPNSTPWSVKSDSGIAYITTQRIVYLPASPTPALTSFACPILSLLDTYVRAPFFGANYWMASVRPVSGGGIPPQHPIVELKLTFREGGAFDWHTCFEGAKDRLHYAREMAGEQGRQVDPSDINLEQLPAYEAATELHDDLPPSFESTQRGNNASAATTNGAANGHNDQSTPDEPPPGYEEAQAQAVEMTFEERERQNILAGRNGDEESDTVAPSR